MDKKTVCRENLVRLYEDENIETLLANARHDGLSDHKIKILIIDYVKTYLFGVPDSIEKQERRTSCHGKVRLPKHYKKNKKLEDLPQEGSYYDI